MNKNNIFAKLMSRITQDRQKAIHKKRRKTFFKKRWILLIILCVSLLGTGLCGVGFIDNLHPTAGAFAFVLQLGFELTPARIEDGLAVP